MWKENPSFINRERQTNRQRKIKEQKQRHWDRQTERNERERKKQEQMRLTLENINSRPGILQRQTDRDSEIYSVCLRERKTVKQTKIHRDRQNHTGDKEKDKLTCRENLHFHRQSESRPGTR